MGIQRWDWDYECVYSHPTGDYVLFTDHEQVVAELKERIDAYHIGQICDKEEIARQAVTIRNLRAELAAKSKDAERIRGELLLVLEWATTENKALRPQEVASIQRALGEGNGR